jgi:TonB family protein
MKKVFLIMLGCLVLHNGTSAQTNTDKPSSTRPQEATRKSETQSPELLEAEKLNVQAIELYNASKFDEAVPLAKRVLQIREIALAPHHDLIVSALLNLGEIYRARGKYGDAKIYFQRILTSYEQSSTPDPAAMVKVLDMLALLNYMQSNYSETEKLYLRALALQEQAIAPNNLQVAASLFNLAEFYRFRGEYKKAEPLYQRAIEIKGSAFGPDDEDVIKSVEHYSCIYYSMNQWEKVKDKERQFSFLRKKHAAAAAAVDNGEVLNGRAISLPKPEYSKLAKANRIEGVVAIKVKIDERGNVIEASDICGAHQALLETAVPAAYRAKFTPTLISGAPVKVTGVIVYRFIAR